MTETAAAAPASTGKPIGTPRGIGKAIVLSIVTLGIYFIV